MFIVKSQPKLSKSHLAAQEMPPGTEGVTYEIQNPQGGNLGWLVEIGPSNVTSGPYTWLASTAYWFWSSSAFPASFRIVLSGSGVRPGIDSGTASSINN